MHTHFGAVQVSLRLVTEPSDHSASNHPPSSRQASGVFSVGLTGPPCGGRPFGAVRQLGFAFPQQARHDGRPNRVHLRCGLIVHLRLLSTPPRGDAVTVGYGVPEHSGRDFHPADSMQLQAHWGRQSCLPDHAGVAGLVGQTVLSARPRRSSWTRRPAGPTPQGRALVPSGRSQPRGAKPSRPR